MLYKDHKIKLASRKIKATEHTTGEWIDVALKLIMNTRQMATCHQSSDETKDETDKNCRHVRATPNNPESSRGHLFTLLDVDFNNEETGKIVVVDCAGSEDPVSIMKDYVSFEEPEGKGKKKSAESRKKMADK